MVARPQEDVRFAPASDGRRGGELEGLAVPNQVYVGGRLNYGAPESLDPVGSTAYLRGLRTHWSLVLIVTLSAGFVIALFGVITGSTKLAGFLGILLLIAAFIVAWFVPIWVGLSEWKFMVDGKAEASAAAFEHIAWAFKERATPVDRIKVHRLRLGGSETRDYLFVKEGIFGAYIACFAYGRDLYVGWTLWWRISAFRWLLLVVRRWIQAFTFRNSTQHWVHRFDFAKALREAIHGAARQGLDAATGLVPFQGSGTIGSEIGIEDIDDSRRDGKAAQAFAGTMR
jgi:hypothetical protein